MTDDRTATVFVICGPTASGKSSLALALAERVGGTVINADSMQVYRGLPILTNQPGAAERARVPHALYGVLEPDDPCSAGRWREMALAAIAEARAEGRVAVVTGGTGLYLKALIEGIAGIPDIDPSLRAAVQARHRALGNAGFHAALAARDAEGAAAIHAGDSQRMIRAMEVLEATGETLGQWQRRAASGPPAGLDFRTVLIDPPREVLYGEIDARFERMLAAGAVAEAAALAARGLDPALPALKALGLAELAAAARGELALEAAVARAKTASRNYAKRQVTWFKRQIVTDYRLFKKFSERDSEKILSEIIFFP